MVPTLIAKMLNFSYYFDQKFIRVKTFSSSPCARESLKPYQTGILVDYLTRLMLTKDAKKAFDIPLTFPVPEAKLIVSQIKPVKTLETVQLAARMLPFDQLYRLGTILEDAPVVTSEDASVIWTLVDRSCELLNYCKSGPDDQIQCGVTFPGALTDVITNGDGDYQTSRALIEMKVSKYPPKNEHWLQLFIYYLMGLNSTNRQNFLKNTHLAVVNPRINAIYTYPVKYLKNIDQLKDALGY